MKDVNQTEPQIDQARWDDLVSSLGEALVEIVDTYLADTPEKIREIRSALTSGDLETVSRVAHSIKSSSGIFGAQRMVRLCKELELAAQENKANLDGQIEVIQKAFNDLANELRAKKSLLSS